MNEKEIDEIRNSCIEQWRRDLKEKGHIPFVGIGIHPDPTQNLLSIQTYLGSPQNIAAILRLAADEVETMGP